MNASSWFDWLIINKIKKKKRKGIADVHLIYIFLVVAYFLIDLGNQWAIEQIWKIECLRGKLSRWPSKLLVFFLRYCYSFTHFMGLKTFARCVSCFFFILFDGFLLLLLLFMCWLLLCALCTLFILLTITIMQLSANFIAEEMYDYGSSSGFDSLVELLCNLFQCVWNLSIYIYCIYLPATLTDSIQSIDGYDGFFSLFFSRFEYFFHDTQQIVVIYM